MLVCMSFITSRWPSRGMCSAQLCSAQLCSAQRLKSWAQSCVPGVAWLCSAKLGETQYLIIKLAHFYYIESILMYMYVSHTFTDKVHIQLVHHILSGLESCIFTKFTWSEIFNLKISGISSKFVLLFYFT